MKTKIFYTAIACAATLFTCSAQDFTLDASAISGGGGQSSSSDFALNGTIGQVDAGSMSGGDFALEGGFWGIIAVLETPGARKGRRGHKATPRTRRPDGSARNSRLRRWLLEGRTRMTRTSPALAVSD
jgi:hypothetical protein